MDDSTAVRSDLVGELKGSRRRAARIQDAPAEESRLADSSGCGPIDLQAALEGKGLLRYIVGQVPMILWAVDCRGVLRLSEGRGLEILGLAPGEAVGRSIWEVFADVPKIKAWTRRALAGESINGCTEVDGIALECWYSPLRGPSGEIIGAAGAASDVTTHKQTEEELLAEQRLAEQMLQSHERDRRLIAYEIHDGLVQDVTAARMHLEASLRTGQIPAGPERSELELALGLIGKAVREARNLISGLRPPILDDLGIVAAIEYLIDDQPADGPSIDFAAEVQPGRLESLLEGTIYRIVQEAIANVKRHSRSDSARIRLIQTEGQIQVEICDWGVGFDTGSIREKRLGLRGIRERARLLRGRASIESSPGKGTRIFVELPVAQAPG